MTMSCAAILMTKFPEPGQVKTRLAPALGFGGAALMARAFVLDEIKALDRAGLKAVIAFAPPDREADFKSWLGPDRDYVPQQGPDLGVRMANALKFALKNTDSALLVGGDLPELGPRVLDPALAALAQGKAVLAPAVDGGYTMIGFPARLFTPRAFEHVPWSDPQTMDRQLDRLDALGLPCQVLPALPDIDTPHALAELAKRLRTSPDPPRQTMAALQKLGLA